MNEIKIYLKTSGSIAELYKDFNLYQQSYHNVKITIYVPTSILYKNQENTFTSSVNTGAILKAPNGDNITTKNYPTYFEKTETVNSIEYSVFSQLMPKEYCVYSGTQIIVCNVVNIDNTDTENPAVIQVITTQTANLVVNQSAYISGDDPIEPSDVQQINSQINALSEDIEENKQDIASLQTTVANNTANITKNTQDIAENRNDIDYLYQNMALSEEYIGQTSGTSLPSDETLNAFVAENTDPSREPKNGDVVIYILVIPNATDRNYKYIYSGTGWNGYELPPMEPADNGTLGLIQGTLNTQNTLRVNISGGKILDIYYTTTEGDQANIISTLMGNTSSIKQLLADVSNIISGATVVGAALKDGSGNIINSYYMSMEDGASKSYVQQYALPRIFNDVYYISSSGYDTTPPTTPESGIQYTVETIQVGDYPLFRIELENGQEYELTQKNSATNIIWVSADKDVTVNFILDTTGYNSGNIGSPLSSQQSGDIELKANTITKLTFNGNFSLLGNDELNNTTKIQQQLAVYTYTSEPIRFNVYSNTSYPSSFNLNVSASKEINPGTIVKVDGVDQTTWDASYVLKLNNTQNTPVVPQVGTNNAVTGIPVAQSPTASGVPMYSAEATLKTATPQTDNDCVPLTYLNTALAGKADDTEITAIQQTLNSKADLVGGKVPASQLPSYVDDVVEYNSVTDFPNPGEEGKIYVDKTTNKTYRWSGTEYVDISGGGTVVTVNGAEQETWNADTKLNAVPFTSSDADKFVTVGADGSLVASAITVGGAY